MARRSPDSAWKTRSERIVSRGLPLRSGWTALGLGVLAVLAALLLLRPGPASPPQEPPPSPTPSAAPSPALRSQAASLPAALASRLDDPRAYAGTPVPLSAPLDEAEARRFVEEQNAAARRQHELLLADGWSPVDVPPPDPAVLALDPALLDGRERDLRVHLETNALHQNQLDNALAIALRAAERRTRHAAIQAIGHARSPKGQQLLTELFDRLEDPDDKSLALGFLRPRSLSEPSVDWMLERLASPGVAPELKKQMTYSLVLAGIVEAGPLHGELLPRLLARVPAEMRPAVLETYQAITRETPKLPP